MAELKLSAVWKIKDFAKKKSQVKNDDELCEFESDELAELQHASSLPGVRWKAALCTSSSALCLFKPKRGYARFNLCALFGSSGVDAKYVWASYSATLLAAGERAVATCVSSGAQEFMPPMLNQKSVNDAFKLEDVNKAVQKDGSLCIRIDLTILNIGELLIWNAASYCAAS